MNPLLVAVVAALLVPAVTRGSYRRLAEASFELVPILLLGLGLQLALDLGVVPESRWHDAGFGLLVASLVLVVAFCVRNLNHRGMGVVLVGVVANTMAIVVNQGMPVDVPSAWLEDGTYVETVKHHAQTPDDTLIVITDIIVIPKPFETVISFGDLVVAVGMVVVVFHASRKPRAARRGHAEAIRPQDIDLSSLVGEKYAAREEEPVAPDDEPTDAKRAPPHSEEQDDAGVTDPDDADGADDDTEPTAGTAVGALSSPGRSEERLLVGGGRVELTAELEHPLQ